MPLRYGQSNPHNKKRIAMMTVAILLLLLAIVVMVLWMFIGYRQNNPPSPDAHPDTPSQYEDDTFTANASLVILDFADSKQFILVQTDPANNAVRVVSIPAHMTDAGGNTLTNILAKHGSMQVVETVSTVLDLSVRHYITWSADGCRSFLNELDHGVTFTLVEEMHYTDDNGSSIRLNAGTQLLTGTQAAAVLQYSEWKDPNAQQQVAAQMIAAVINQYLVPQQNLSGYFAALADHAQTDLRIDHFNAFRRTLSHLADSNRGALCHVISLIGADNGQKFVPDVRAMREQTDLYA